MWQQEIKMCLCILCQAMRASSSTKRRRNIRVHCWAVLLGWKAQRSSCIVGCCGANVEPAIQKQQISSTCPSIRSVSSPSNGISSFSLPMTRGFDMLFHAIPLCWHLNPTFLAACLCHMVSPHGSCDTYIQVTSSWFLHFSSCFVFCCRNFHIEPGQEMAELDRHSVALTQNLEHFDIYRRRTAGTDTTGRRQPKHI